MGGKVTLYRLIGYEDIEKIKREGIQRKRMPKEAAIVPQREFCVFAYDEVYAKEVAEYGGAKARRDVWVKFVVDEDKVFVGELYYEGQPEKYKASFMPYSTYKVFVHPFREAEMVVTTDIPVADIIGFYERRTFKPIEELGVTKETREPMKWWKH